jgi:predicted Zn-dependent protease
VGIVVLHIPVLNAQDANVILSSIKKEVDRSKSELMIDKLKSPFFISYAIVDIKSMSASASLGSLLNSSQISRRTGVPFLLVGDYEKNNLGYGDMYRMSRNICLENDPVGIATAIWQDLDDQYKNAAERYEAKMSTIRQLNIPAEDLAVADFEKTKSIQLILPVADYKQDKAYWEEYVKKASAALLKYPALTSSSISANNAINTCFYYDTENSQYVVSEPYYRIGLSVEAITADGQTLNDYFSIEHRLFERMPDVETFTKACETFTANFLKLLDAPMIDDAYCGPVLFESQPLVQSLFNYFMNQQALIARPKPVGGGFMNSLEMKMNKKVISRSLSIKSITGLQTYDGMPLEGYYPIDFEGVVPEPEFFLIENGVLKSLLNRRTPTKKVPNSNGHYRFGGMMPQVLPGNILLTSNTIVPKADLKKKLIEAAKAEDLDYAFIIRRMSGNTIMAYKVYVEDGREELVRGAKLDGFALNSFKRRLSASGQNVAINIAANSVISTCVVPDGIIFEELDITKDGNINLNTPFSIPKPAVAVK